MQLVLLVASVLAHNVPINPLLGEGGYPDCVNSASPEGTNKAESPRVEQQKDLFSRFSSPLRAEL